MREFLKAKVNTVVLPPSDPVAVDDLCAMIENAVVDHMRDARRVRVYENISALANILSDVFAGTHFDQEAIAYFDQSLAAACEEWRRALHKVEN